MSFPWDKVDWLVVNEEEARELFEAVGGGGGGGGGGGDVPVQEARELVRALGALEAFRNTSVVCTLGARGVLALRRRRPEAAADLGLEVEREMVYVPAATLRGAGGVAKDTTGAGDCFAGYFVCGLMELADAYAAAGEDGKAEMSQVELERILRVAVQVSARTPFLHVGLEFFGRGLIFFLLLV